MRSSTPLYLLCVLFFINTHRSNAQCLTADAGPNRSICSGGSVQLGPASPAGGATYAWSPATFLNNPNIANPVASPWYTITYTLTVTPPITNLLANGDFGQGNVGFVTDSSYSPAVVGIDSTYPGAYAITANPDSLYHGSCSGGDHTPNNAMMVVDGSTVAGAPCWKQTVSVTPNTSYNFSGWYMATTSDSPRALITVSINGVVVFGPQQADSLCSWAQMTASWNSGSSTTATIAISSASSASTGNDFALDDLLFYQNCAASQASTTVTVQADPPFVNMAWVTDGFDPGTYAMNSSTGQNDMCGYYQSWLSLTLFANRSQVAWYIDGAQVTNGSTAPGFQGTVTIINNGQTLKVSDLINDFSNHSFQVGDIGSGCTMLSPALYFRRIPNVFKKGSGYISANSIGTISQRNTAYTFNITNIAPAIMNNYGMGTAFSWSVPGVTVSVNPFDHRIITVTVPTGYTPSVDPGTGAHYIPGTLTISNSSYSCLNTSYSINFAVPAISPNSSVAGVINSRSTALNDANTSDGILQLFPNPARDMVSIQPGILLGNDGYVEIFTSAGRRVLVIRAAAGAGQTSLQVNIADLSNGLYFVVVHGRDGIARSKFLIAR